MDWNIKIGTMKGQVDKIKGLAVKYYLVDWHRPMSKTIVR